jgi:NAD(P)-dependent dehydrogenase (short-subunit alcohol dehydrogenase family)
VCLQNGAAKVWSLDIGKPSAEFGGLAEQFPGRLSSLLVDITDADQVSGGLEEIVNQCGRLDGMVANAGITKHKPALDFTKEEISRLFDVNVSHCPRSLFRYGVKC